MATVGSARVDLETIQNQWSGSREDPSIAGPSLLHEVFEARADAHPDRIALACGDKQKTYAQLERRANQMARYLRSKGVRRGDTVAMLLPRSNHVYATLLGILKAGAAYVPLDCDCPADRVSYILADCQIRTIVTTSRLAETHGLTGPDAILLDRDGRGISRESHRRLRRTQTGVRPDDLCYIIYTSGSTGRPKGVQIEHRSACNLVLAEGQIFQVRPQDRVYQGFNIAFDASVEEIWLALSAGATLVAGTAEMVHAGAALPAMLFKAGVTVLSCVPTLLSMMQDDIPGLRLLILGGEPCPQDLVRRWCRPGRRVVNTYGPTEATVIATFADCHPDQPVTIGRPVPNYRVHLLDACMEPVPTGAIGEIHIGGVGLSRGYVGRADLTAERFVSDPFADSPDERLYKTGDLGRYTSDGQIEFMGRADSQVKLRGFRVELGEIESAMLECPCVQAAAVTVREDVPGIQQLVGYAVPRGDAPLDEDAIRARLRSRLPAYMIPALIETLADLPTLASGKVDRKKLPAPALRNPLSHEDGDPPRTDLERKIATAWRDLFASAAVSRDADFFLDLGGHSLLAARMVSALREDPDFRDLSMLDVYNHPTLAALAARFEARRNHDAPARKAVAAAEGPQPSRASHRLCGLAQAACLYLLKAFASLQWLVPYLAYEHASEDGCRFWPSVFIGLAILPVIQPLLLVGALAVKWTVIGRFRPGTWPLWSLYYLRWWFVQRVLSMAPTHALIGTPLLNVYYRLLGARIGANVYLGTDHIGAFDLLRIGDDSSIGLETSLLGHTVEQGMLRIGPIRIGKRCFIGTRSMVRPGARMQDDARLANLSLLPEDSTVPAGQTWAGSPARPQTPEGDECLCRRGAAGRPRRAVRLFYAVLHAIGVLLLSAVYLAAALPGTLLIVWLGRRYDGDAFLLASPLVAVSFVLTLPLAIALVKRMLLGQVQPGQYPVHSGFYVRKWFVDQLMDMSLVVLGPLYATLYVIPWLRLLGVRLGRRAEVSTAHSVPFDLLSIGEESFIADSVSLGAARIDRGVMTIAHTRVGRRTFVGNSATVPPRTDLPDGCLIGVMTLPPASFRSPAAAVEPGTSWLGSPALFLPRRQAAAGFSEQTTFRPARKLYALRLFVEFFRVTLPATLTVLLNSLLVLGMVRVSRTCSTAAVLLIVPLMELACGLAAAAIVVAAKWLLMGRYKPDQKPLWSLFVWRTELLTALHEGLADPFLIRLLQGTPFICWFFRLLGARIGSRVYMDTTSLTEFDLIAIGEGAALNQDCVMQTHLFEDRIMKMSTVTIGAGCSVGARAIVLYDAGMEDGAVLRDLSLVMKGETLPPFTCWQGTPASRAVAASPDTGSRPAGCTVRRLEAVGAGQG